MVMKLIYPSSQTLNDAQMNYPIIEKELFAVVFAYENFRSYITYSKVRVCTDRMGLKEILERTDIKPRMIRWILLLQEFDLQIIQRSEERLEDQESVDKEALPCSISTVFFPSGTLRTCEGVAPILCDGARKYLLATIYGKRGGTK
jgi:hypothetical protein